jgi:hypothetical protein
VQNCYKKSPLGNIAFFKVPHEIPQDFAQELLQDFPQELLQELPQDLLQELSQELRQGLPQELPQEFLQEPPQELVPALCLHARLAGGAFFPSAAACEIGTRKAR